MKHGSLDVAEVIRQQIAELELVIEPLRRALAELERGAGPQVRTIARRLPRHAGRPTVRRAKAKAAKALRTANGQRRQLAPGSLADRIVQVLTEFAAPMRKGALIDAVKARPADVMADAKALRKDKRIVLVGATRAARYAVPKFAHVIVADA